MKVDERLLLDIKDGRIKAFEKFFQNSHARLLNYAKIFIPDAAIADDMVQEAFIHFWNKRKELRVGKSIESLIFTSVRNRCLNYLRDENIYKKHKEGYKVEENALQFIGQYDFLGEEGDSLEEMLIKELENSIEQLPDKCRQVFLMSKKEGIKQKDIAEQLGISPKAVEKHIATAKVKIRENMQLKFPTLGILIAFFMDL